MGRKTTATVLDAPQDPTDTATDPSNGDTIDVSAPDDGNGSVVTAPVETTPEVTLPGGDVVRPRLIWVDPRELLANARNVRTDPGDLTELRDSIAANGVWQSLVGVDTAEGITLVMGHGRAAAAAAAIEELNAAKAAEVPVLVHTSMDIAMQIAAMIEENVRRRALSTSDEANGYHQLTLEGWTAEQISQRTGSRRARVEQALILAGLDRRVQNAVDADQLTLDDAAALAQFEDDPKALQRILSKGAQWGFRHQLAEEQRKRRVANAKADLTAELKAAGVTIIPRPKDFPYRSREEQVTFLRGSDGERLQPEDVWNKTGFAAFIETYHDAVSAVVVCLDPEAHGYTRMRHSNYVSPEEAARRAEAAEANAARRAGLATAAEVRATFLIEAYGSAKAAKKLYVDALRAVVGRPHDFSVSTRYKPLVKALTGTNPDDDLTAAGEARLTRFLVGLWIAAQEDNLDDAASGRYCARRADAAAWLDRLAEAGYDLSDAEQDLRHQLALCSDCQAAPGAQHDIDCSQASRTESPDGPFTLLPEGGQWFLLDAHGDELTRFDAAADQIEAATTWASTELNDTYGLNVTAWRTDSDNDGLIAEVTDSATDADEAVADDADAGPTAGQADTASDAPELIAA